MKSDRNINPSGKGSCTVIILARTPDLVGACDNRIRKVGRLTPETSSTLGCDTKVDSNRLAQRSLDADADVRAMTFAKSTGYMGASRTAVVGIGFECGCDGIVMNA